MPPKNLNEFGADDDFVCTAETPWHHSMGMTFKHPDVVRITDVNPDNGGFIVECAHCEVGFHSGANNLRAEDIRLVDTARAGGEPGEPWIWRSCPRCPAKNWFLESRLAWGCENTPTEAVVCHGCGRRFWANREHPKEYRQLYFQYPDIFDEGVDLIHHCDVVTLRGFPTPDPAFYDEAKKEVRVSVDKDSG